LALAKIWTKGWTLITLFGSIIKVPRNGVRFKIQLGNFFKNSLRWEG